MRLLNCVAVALSLCVAVPAYAQRPVEEPVIRLSLASAGAVQSTAPSFNTPADRAVSLIVEGVESRTARLRLTRNGTPQEFPVTVSPKNEATITGQTFPVGTYSMGVAACDAFGCSEDFAFTIVSNTPPAKPSGVRLMEVIAQSLKNIAEALDVVIADAR